MNYCLVDVIGQMSVKNESWAVSEFVSYPLVGIVVLKKVGKKKKKMKKKSGPEHDLLVSIGAISLCLISLLFCLCVKRTYMSTIQW